MDLERSKFGLTICRVTAFMFCFTPTNLQHEVCMTVTKSG